MVVFMHTIEGGKNFNLLHQSVQHCRWKYIHCTRFVFDNWWFSFQGQRWQWHWNFFLSYRAYSMLVVHYLIYFTFLGQRICEETIVGMVNNSFLKLYFLYLDTIRMIRLPMSNLINKAVTMKYWSLQRRLLNPFVYTSDS